MQTGLRNELLSSSVNFLYISEHLSWHMLISFLPAFLEIDLYFLLILTTYKVYMVIVSGPHLKTEDTGLIIKKINIFASQILTIFPCILIYLYLCES